MSKEHEKLKDQLLAAVEGNTPAGLDTDPELASLVDAAKSTPLDLLKPAWAFANRAEVPPEAIGPFRVLDVLGQGGMGIVYRALQTKPLERLVALKVIRPDLVTESGLARFDLERAVLGRLSHTNVATILETGTCKEGQPFIAMELVAGPTLTKYTIGQNLSLAQRLKLFVAICNGVSHAHARGVIHRDLKPSNVLIVEQDGNPVPKIIDFGIAKVLGGGLTERLTITDQVLGTLEYVSPEVIESGAIAADVRSDVYALGAILYELVTGVPPICLDDVRDQGILKVLNTAKQAIIVRPSKALKDSSHKHSVSATELGDLNCVILHALERNPDSRYQSAAELANDISRFLRHETILATPPSRVKIVKSFVRRHWIGLPTVAAVILTLGTGFAVSYSKYLEAERSRIAAVETLQQAEEAIRVLRDVALSANVRDQDAKMRLAAIGTSMETLLNEKSLSSPRTRFELQIMLGHAYDSTGKQEEAERILMAAWDSAAAEWAGPNERFVSSIRLAELYNNRGRSAEATKFAREAVECAIENDNAAQRGHADYVLACSLVSNGKLDESASIFESILNSDRPVAEVEPALARARAQVMLGTVQLQQREFEESVSNTALGYETYKRLRGFRFPNTLMAGHNLATVLGALHHDEEALEIFAEILPARKAVLGPDHPDTLMTMTIMARTLADLGRTAEAEPLFQDALSIGDEKYQARNPIGALAAGGLAKLCTAKGDFEQAIELSERTVQYAKAMHGESDWKVEIYQTRLAVTYLNAGQPERALKLASNAQRILAEAVGETHPYTTLAAKTVTKAEAARIE